ncbi:hypothetical protein [Dialister hominis]|uniref:hypothetical protein n=1 Tax=Dialister hominis TaxID=2582419 RepID=UPI004029A291
MAKPFFVHLFSLLNTDECFIASPIVIPDMDLFVTGMSYRDQIVLIKKSIRSGVSFSNMMNVCRITLFPDTDT